MLSLSRSFSKILTNIVLATPKPSVQSLCAIPAASRFSTNAEKAELVDEEDQKKLDAEELKRQEKDRTKQIPVETSIKYLKSSAYKETYGDKFVWIQYRRNHKGAIPPKKTRKTCIRQGKISTGNPCPICRDEYLVLDHRNVDLLKQFISPQSGEVLSYTKTGLCQKKHFELLVAVEKAWDRGLIEFDVPFREFDYSEYIEPAPNKQTN